MLFPGDEQFERYVRYNRFLTLLLIPVAIGLCVFLVLHFVSAWKAVQEPPVSDELLTILKAVFWNFFEGFDPVTGKLMLYILIWIFSSCLLIDISLRIPLFESAPGIVFVIPFLAIGLVYMLPMERFYAHLADKEKLGMACLVSFIGVFGGPVAMGKFLGKHYLTSKIFMKLTYVIVFGLILAQVLILNLGRRLLNG